VTSITNYGTQKSAKTVRLSKPTDMTIHWKALEGHILIVPVEVGCVLLFVDGLRLGIETSDRSLRSLH
jgi:hypothetical protein